MIMIAKKSIPKAKQPKMVPLDWVPFPKVAHFYTEKSGYKASYRGAYPHGLWSLPKCMAEQYDQEPAYSYDLSCTWNFPLWHSINWNILGSCVEFYGSLYLDLLSRNHGETFKNISAHLDQTVVMCDYYLRHYLLLACVGEVRHIRLRCIHPDNGGLFDLNANIYGNVITNISVEQHQPLHTLLMRYKHWEKMTDWTTGIQNSKYQTRTEFHKKFIPAHANSSVNCAVNVILTDTCRMAFDHLRWLESYGSDSWSAIADLLFKRLTGRITPMSFIDYCFNLQHNSGSLFGKLVNCSLAGDSADPNNTSRTFVAFLNLKQRAKEIYELMEFVAIYGTSELQLLWKEFYEKTGEPILFRKDRKLDSMCSDLEEHITVASRFLTNTASRRYVSDWVAYLKSTEFKNQEESQKCLLSIQNEISPLAK